VADTGESCLPADDPTLVSRVADQISSCGFAVTFVIDAADDVALPTACDQLVQCCDAMLGDNKWCYDIVDSSTLAVDFCSANLSSMVASQCPGVAASGDGGAGDASNGGSGAQGDGGVSSRYKLCCYHSCGYFACT
jgi:hypothetical protein